ncbi:cation:proton antiporter regulatory subunit [Peribacillus frigoritolerans]|uniref:cation:proton antiporter regulatory subunit n=1 Tax=Peribacillus frigoritolerans TaxID=450367 RepID=UPI0007BF3AA6|nr:cation:proton antiporter regulatory subunit [Peribacillus frigoritolerans]USK65694.1 cation:proton antiporter regulatory subunit [Peribacillus frigoritolerans]
MKIRESELPGIGQKFEIITRNDEKLVIVIHDDGRRELYHFDNEHEDVISSITLNDQESRQLASIIGGMVYKPQALETIEMSLGDLVIEWFKVETGSKAINQTIGSIDIRSNYNVTVIAHSKKGKKQLNNPGPDSIIETGDTLVISGERKDIRNLIRELLTDERSD